MKRKSIPKVKEPVYVQPKLTTLMPRRSVDAWIAARPMHDNRLAFKRQQWTPDPDGNQGNGKEKCHTLNAQSIHR